MGGGGAPSRNLYKEMSGELQARADLMPEVFASEAKYRPQFNALETGNINDLLHGTAAGTKELEYQDYETQIKRVANGRISGGNQSGLPRYRNQEVRVPVTRTRTIATEATPGLIAMQRSADPATAEMYDKLTAASNRELDMGGQLSPADMRQVQQTVRQRNQGSLGNTGTAGNYNEALGVSAFANQLRNQRRANAMTVAGTNDARTNTLFNRAQGISRGSGPRLFGSSIDANDVASSNQNAAAANNAADAQMTTAGIAAGAGILAALI